MGRVISPPAIIGPDDKESSGPTEPEAPPVTEPNTDNVVPDEAPDNTVEGTDPEERTTE
ncbi:hypothetical protein KRP69_01530 [Mammaliicoccus sciuri]|uniref:hypothetical protein n=1 Tax=Mammaliicoccus sciuri TaxID=1296 RepID=UPI001D0D57B3|nr:hypothetical protein [Mammaliicoccus sciuri]MCC2087885.1 hypothetical protein [Mammaliicoccus sciuri]